MRPLTALSGGTPDFVAPKKGTPYGAYSKGQFLKFNKVRYLPTGKGRRAVKLLVLFSLQALLLWTQKLFFVAIYLLSQMRYIFAACHASYAQKRYNLPCGRLRYDINPLHAPQDISHRRYIARDSVYRKSHRQEGQIRTRFYKANICIYFDKFPRNIRILLRKFVLPILNICSSKTQRPSSLNFKMILVLAECRQVRTLQARQVPKALKIQASGRVRICPSCLT